LLDGVSINDAFGNWTYWSRVPRIAVEQTEVLRGGASALYGSGALSGAINVLTKTAEDDKPVLRLETSGGTQNTIDGSLFTAYRKKGWAGSLALESFQTKGYFPVPENERGSADAPANSRHSTVLLELERKFNQNLRIFGRGNLFAERRDNGTSLQKNRTFYRQAVLGGDFSNENLGSFALRSFFETQVYDQTFSGVSADRNSENLTRLQRVPSQAAGANLLWSRVFPKNHTISAGVETREVRGFSDEIIFNANRATSTVGAGGKERDVGVFVGDFWQINQKLNLNFGGRFDSWRNLDALSTTNNLTGSSQTTLSVFPVRTQTAFSPRFAAIYQATDKILLLASFTRSFRAPTLNELYRAFRVGNILTLANENLRAERANTIEAGARYAFFANKFNLRGNAFWTNVSNPVVNVTISQTPALITRQRQNLGGTRSRGLEVDLEANARENLQFSAGYLLVDARVINFPGNPNLVDKFLPQVAKHQFTFNTFYRPKSRFSLGIQGRAGSAQFDDDQNNFRLRPFLTIDTFGSYRLLKNVEIFAAAENVFNNRYDIALTPTRNVAAPVFIRIGLRFRLGGN
jgi:outer membrane receptor protein involved in Fe transport